MFRLDDEDDNGSDERGADPRLLSRLLKTRTIVLAGEINKKLGEKITVQLLILDGENHKPIRLFVDTPGGDADAGYAIFDMIRFVDSPVNTISNGLTASAGVIVTLAAPKERRFSFPSSRWLIHQPSSGMFGTASDIKIHAEEILKLKHRINELIAKETGQEIDKVKHDTDRDRWLSAQQALEYGLISRILTNASELK